jgi:hypothetical protein
MRLIFFTAFLVLAAQPMPAQEPPKGSLFSDEMVTQFQKLALKNIGHAKCDDTAFCMPATAEEESNPPLTIEETRQIMKHGFVSAQAKHCHLDWEGKNFLLMMRHWRETLRKSPRQMALVGLTHGILMGMTEKPLAKEPCTEALRRQVEKKLLFQP